MKLTIKDIAKIAGVNHSTVSRCLNDSNLVSKETKEKIKKIAEELGFEFNSNARGLSTKKTFSIGIITPDYFEENGAGQFFGIILKNIINELEEYGYDTIIKFPRNKNGERNILKIIRQNKIDGLILLHSDITNEEVEMLKKHKIPVVVIHIKFNENKFESINSFITNHYIGGWLAAEYLYQNNCSKFTIVKCLPGVWEFDERSAGFFDYLKTKNIKEEDIITLKSDIHINSGKQLAINYREYFLDRGIFVQADIVAVGIMMEIGKEIKKMVGYDDIFMSKIYNFTTIHQPVEKLAKEGVEKLMLLIQKKDIEIQEKIIPPYLVVRGT